MKVFTKKSQSILRIFCLSFRMLGRVRETGSRRSGDLMRRPSHKRWKSEIPRCGRSLSGGQRPYKTCDSCSFKKVGRAAAEALASAPESEGMCRLNEGRLLDRYPVKRSEEDIYTLEMEIREVHRRYGKKARFSFTNPKFIFVVTITQVQDRIEKRSSIHQQYYTTRYLIERMVVLEITGFF